MSKLEDFTHQSLKDFELTDHRDLLTPNGQVPFDEFGLDLPAESWTSLLCPGSIKKSKLQHPILGPDGITGNPWIITTSPLLKERASSYPKAPMMLGSNALRASPRAKSIP